MRDIVENFYYGSFGYFARIMQFCSRHVINIYCKFLLRQIMCNLLKPFYILISEVKSALT